MAIMAEIMENIVRNNITVSDVKCLTEIRVLESAPLGQFENLTSNRGGKEDVGGDIEHSSAAERKRKTRRRKAKRKNPYTIKQSDSRGKKSMRLRESKSYEQPVAPYNSNQFLIEDHNDLKDFDSKLIAAANRLGEQNNSSDLSGAPRTGRVRDASFTSAESDEDYFYSSPEDEEEFLTKEFSNTYQDLHVESLTAMTKTELIQTILQLEERIDSLQKQLGDTEPEGEDPSSTTTTTTPSGGSKSPGERALQYQTELSKLVLANQKLANENARLREGTNNNGRCSSTSSEDSESDSSSSSNSSIANSEDEETKLPLNTTSTTHMNGFHTENDDVNMDPTDNT